MKQGAGHLKLCWDILPEVSRSFALCIKMLPRPTDERMMISYLLLRILDTVEDSQAPAERKLESFSKILTLLKEGGGTQAEVLALKDLLCGEIDHTYEKGLLENVGSVMAVFGGFPQPVRIAITDCAQEMARGMMKFQNLKITDFARQEEYCHYVAGIVGYLDTRLFHLGGHIGEPLRDELMENSRLFGIALQKVNVLRDVAYDIPEGRHFWPSDVLAKHGLEYDNLCSPDSRPKAMELLNEMVADALPYLDAAIDYVTRLPRTAVRVRVFCLIPLFMAIKSYAVCVGSENVFIKGKKVKLSRAEVNSIVRLSFLLAPSNWALRRWYDNSLRSVAQKVSATRREPVPV